MSCPVAVMCFSCRGTDDLRVTTADTHYGEVCWTVCKSCYTLRIPLRAEFRAWRFLADNHREHLGLPPREPATPPEPQHAPITVPPLVDEPRRAAHLLHRYLRDESDDRPTGALFDDLGGGGDRSDVVDVFAADDLVAVSMLGASIGGRAALRILDADASRLSRMLADVPADVDLADAGTDDLYRATDLWNELRALPGIGEVAAGRLVARKRPRLVPVVDTVVLRVLGHPGPGFWADLRHHLRDDDRRLEGALIEIRDVAQLRDRVTVIRTRDILARVQENPRLVPPDPELL